MDDSDQVDKHSEVIDWIKTRLSLPGIHTNNNIVTDWDRIFESYIRHFLPI